MLRRFQLAGHHPDAAGRRRHRHDRRPVGQVGRAQPPHPRAARRTTSPASSAQLSRILDFDSKANPARLVDNADWTARRRLPRFPARHREAFLGERHGGEGERARPHGGRRAGSATPSSATCCSRRTTSTTCGRPTTASCRSAARDQWGNITAGTDLIRKKLGGQRLGPDLPADHQGRRHEVRQDRGGGRVARSGEDEPLPVLPVLHQHRGQHGAVAT